MSRHYHLIGAGGIGMGALALLLLAKGRRVSGSDLKESPMTSELRSKGVRIFIGHDGGNLSGADTVVYSTAIKSDNPELCEARRKGIPILRRAELLAELMQEHFAITIAGAHGKTTTSAMVSNALLHAGLNPTMMVGGIVHGLDSNARLGEGRYFVAEVDESDGSFLNFRPDISVITNIDFEHVDFYQNWERILDAYHAFMERTNTGGIILACGDDHRLKSLLLRNDRKKRTYGIAGDNDFRAEDVRYERWQSSYICRRGEETVGEIKLSVPGRHNVLNSLACVAVGLELEIRFDVLQNALENFRSVQRRFQLIGAADGVMIVDDYGHHPTEIETTLRAAQQVKARRLIVVFQPHRYTRLKYLMAEFAQALVLSDYLIITDVYAASETPLEGINAPRLCEETRRLTDKTVVYLPRHAILEHLMGMIQDGDLVLTLGAGDITKTAHELWDRWHAHKVV